MLASVDDLMDGKDATTQIEIPPDVLDPVNLGAADDQPRSVELRPLTVRDVQLIARASKDDEVLTSILMIQRAVVTPELSQKQIAEMHSGLVGFLVEQINRISGLHATEDELRDLAESPVAQAFFVLAREFNWTPQQVRELTLGQILGYLEMLNHGNAHP